MLGQSKAMGAGTGVASGISTRVHAGVDVNEIYRRLICVLKPFAFLHRMLLLVGDGDANTVHSRCRFLSEYISMSIFTQLKW